MNFQPLQSLPQRTLRKRDVTKKETLVYPKSTFTISLKTSRGSLRNRLTKKRISRGIRIKKVGLSKTGQFEWDLKSVGMKKRLIKINDL